MLHRLLVICFALVVSGLLLSLDAPGNAPEASGWGAASDTLIRNARSAAPAELARRSTVQDWEGRILQEGENGWICYPDAPDTPRNDPMCLDGPLQELLRAWQQKEDPRIRTIGFGYMLQGGGGESASEPYADKPGKVDDWIVAPPHLLVVVPDQSLLEGLPNEPGSGGPWVMWNGTPYAHVMVPVPRRVDVPTPR